MSFLPETAEHKLPDTLAEGEAMGKGDTLWSACRNRKQKKVETTSGENEIENNS